MTEPVVRPRRWWVAALLSLVSSGMAGYLYVGRPRRALAAAIIVAVFLLGYWHGLWGWFARPGSAILIFTLALLAQLFFVIDAIRIARRSDDYALRPYNAWWVYGAAVVASILATNLEEISGGFVTRSVRSFQVSSQSMLPTLWPGDRLFADMRAYDTRDPARGDLAVVGIAHLNAIYIMRVVGLPGDRVQMRDGILNINGAPAGQEGAGTLVVSSQTDGEMTFERIVETLPGGTSHFELNRNKNGLTDNTEVFEVPAGAYFMLGDNRDMATDSRVPAMSGGPGFVPRANFFGKVSWIYWPPDFSRIGKTVE